MPPAFTSIHAGSPNVTSLTFDDQSRTLTCTSTGGPATTVTWRRDGIVITLNDTHQQTKSVVDLGNGTYQTVLTIDPSVGYSDIVGTYNCTVENDRGGSSETVVVPGETWTLLFSIHATVTYIEAHTKLWCRKFCRISCIPKLSARLCVAKMQKFAVTNVWQFDAPSHAHKLLLLFCWKSCKLFTLASKLLPEQYICGKRDVCWHFIGWLLNTTFLIQTSKFSSCESQN